MSDTDILVLDELHKMPDWKNYLKGLYDTKPSNTRLLVTGSARLEIFSQAGDSLAGRYFLHRLLPFTPAELYQDGAEFELDELILRGGFPEPLFADSVIDADRWRMQYTNALLSVDVFDLEKIQNIRALLTLVALLRERVGSPISYHSLAQDLAISAMTVKRYIQVLEALYIVFCVTPFSKNIARSLLKEPKIYFFDTGLVNGDKGAKFENLVALSLLKHTYAKVDSEAQPYVLHYLRTKDRHEVDFALANNGEIESIIEAKYSDREFSKSLLHFAKKYDLQGIQVVKDLQQERLSPPLLSLRKAKNYLSELML